MSRRTVTIIGVTVGVVITALLVAAAIWPVVSEVETGKTPEYADLQPQYYTAEPARVFESTRDTIEALEQWRVRSAESTSFTVNGVQTTAVFGFEHDVTIWVEPVTEFVTRVRVRSASRIGKGDFGQNARNIRTFFRGLDERLGAVTFDPERLEEGTPDEPGVDRAPETE
jgi:uncharacterized protein (DUF1499 family)